jgi:hypothetical protein
LKRRFPYGSQPNLAAAAAVAVAVEKACDA